MRRYKIESYVPEANFLSGKDARFCRTAFEDAFVLDVHTPPTVIASCKGSDKIEFSMADAANLLTLFKGGEEVLILPYPNSGTLLVYPAWRHLEMALAFLVKESPDEVEKAYQNAQRHAFSAVFAAQETTATHSLETKLCVLNFYRKHLFGDERQTNVTAQILMLANLLGCRLHEMSVSRVNITLEERELERLSAYLACTFMTLRRYNSEVFTSDENDQNTANLTHVSQEYGLYIQQSVRQNIAKPTVFDIPKEADVARFVNHPAFADYQTEKDDAGIRLHLPLRQKTLLSSFSSPKGERELVLTLFPFK